MVVIKSKIVRIFKSRKINVFFLFFLLAFVILILTKLSKEYTNTIVLDVKPEGVPEEVIVLNDSTHRLKVTLTTHGFKWFNFYMKTPELTIDFSEDVNKTEDFFIWSTSKGFSNINDQFDKNTKIKSINPDTLKFKYDVNAVKHIPVKVNAQLTFSPGYDMLNEIEINPDTIKVIGPASILAELEYLETEDLVLKNVKTAISNTLSIQTKSIDDKVKYDFEEVEASAVVERFTEGTLSIPIQVINVPKGIRLKHFPKNVKVSYYTSLEAFKDVREKDFRVVCDYNDLEKNSIYLTPRLTKKPRKVKSTRLHQQKIEFIITE